MLITMYLREFLLILVSFVLGLFCIHRIRLLDRYEKEPFWKLLLTTLLGGGCALLTALGLFEVMDRIGFRDFESYFGTMLVIGPIEELAKLIGLVVVLGIIRNELNEPADGIIYLSCVALGFSLIENILYANYPTEEYLLLVRLLTATPLHICFSALMGLTFYFWYKNRRAYLLLLTGYLLASLSHGFYDLVVFNHYSVLLLGTIVVLMYGFTRNLLIYALTVSPHRISLAQAIDTSKGTGAQGRQACLHCGGDKTQSHAFERITMWHCQSCDRMTVTLDDLFRLFYHFAGIFKSTARKHVVKDEENKDFVSLYEGNRICPKRKLAVFRLRNLNAVLENLNYAMKSRMKSKWYLPNNLYRLDQQGASVDYTKMIRDSKVSFWYRLLFPFSEARRKTYHPPASRRTWQWGAFYLPEWWYPAKGLWGVMLPIAAFYLLAIYLATIAGISLFLTLGIAAVLTRVVSGVYGARIYYRRYGRWP